MVRGDRDGIGLTDGERRGLDACAWVRTVAVADAGHLALVEQPAAVASVVAEAAAATVR
ncbi:hypothetical protein [Streptomyces sp. NPDC012616]|uniref:hypothetical protein n=1 Tax=Streptomyces sp. NPDC012616 TaxID=3364840 RepID=UPI0036F005B2